MRRFGSPQAICVKIPNSLVEQIDQLVREGRYASRSDFIRAAVREMLRIEYSRTDNKKKGSSGDRAVSVVGYLVAQALAGRHEIVAATYMYYVGGLSPSEIARHLSLHTGGCSSDYNISSINVVRGVITRMREKIYAGSLSYSHQYVRNILKKYSARIASIEPVIDKHGFCSICGRHISKSAAVSHIIVSHSDVVGAVVRGVVGVSTAVQKNTATQTATDSPQTASKASAYP